MILGLLLFCLAAPLFGQDMQTDFAGEGVVVVKNFVLQGTVLIKYRGELTEVAIPEEFGITEIADGAFNNSKITAITIPEGVQKIGCSFYGCYNLVTVNFPSTLLSIGDDAFGWCRDLRRITIPENVSFIGERVFEVCPSLEVIDVHEKNPAFAGIEGVLYNKARTGLVRYPAGKKGDAYTIPQGVTSIGNMAFLSSDLVSISIPASVAFIGEEVFNNCGNLTEINVDARNNAYSSIRGVLFNKNKTWLVRCPQKYDGTAYAIPPGVRAISEDAFRGSRLTSVTLPASITFIGTGAFAYCSRLTGLVIPEGAAFIGEDTFYNCFSLASISIPASVISIGKHAFRECSSLTELVIPDGVESISGSAFFRCFGLASITMPETVTSIGRFAFGDCRNLVSITIPRGVKSIEEYAFFDCSSLKTVEISRHTRIGREAFPLNIKFIYRD